MFFQYVSCSWDATVRVWNAWKLPKKKRKPTKDARPAEGSGDVGGTMDGPLTEETYENSTEADTATVMGSSN